jgi:hypothetical protein
MKKQNILLLILFSWLCGLACCHLFTGNNRDKNDPVVLPGKDYKKVQQRLQEKETGYRQQNDSLIRYNSELNKALNETSVTLAVTKKEKNRLQATLYRTIQQQQSFKKDKDTVRLLANCDSLERQTSSYLLAVTQQDSLHESITGNLAAQLQNRDTIISVKEKQYLYLRQQFDYSMVQQKLLEEQAVVYKRKMKQQQFSSKLKNIGIVILSGIVLLRR